MSMVQTLASKLTLTTDLSPVDRDRNYKGRIKQFFSTLTTHPLQTLLINLLGVLFWAPLIVVFTFILPEIAEKAVLNGYEFVGGLGIGYGATDPDVIRQAIEAVYKTRIFYVGCYLIPCIMFASIGMAGVYNCMRNLLWEVECKTLKHFFLGIKRHWYKFLIVFTVLGAVAVGFIIPLLEVRMDFVAGNAQNAGWWVMLIFMGLVALFAIMYAMILVPMLVTYKYDQKWYVNLGICLKNAAIIVCISPLQIMIVSILVSAPMALCLVPSIAWVMVAIVAIYGIVFYTVLSIAYSQFYSDNYIYYLYNRNVEDMRRQQQKEAKAIKQQKEKQQQRQSYKKKKK